MSPDISETERRWCYTISVSTRQPFMDQSVPISFHRDRSVLNPSPPMPTVDEIPEWLALRNPT